MTTPVAPSVVLQWYQYLGGSVTRIPYSEGFTIVEVVVSLSIVALFVTFFFQLYMTTESQRIESLRRATAADIAYSNLRKFGTRPTNLSCTSDMDLTTNANAPGTEISNATYEFTAETTPAVLGQTASQVVTAFAPNGCSDFSNNPVKIVSKVSYGTKGEEVIHVSFVN